MEMAPRKPNQTLVVDWLWFGSEIFWFDFVTNLPLIVARMAALLQSEP